MTEIFTGNFTQQEPILDEAIEAAVAVMRHGRLHRYNEAAGEVTREYLFHAAGFGLAVSKVNPLLPAMSQTDQNLHACRAGLRLPEKPI